MKEFEEFNFIPIVFNLVLIYLSVYYFKKSHLGFEKDLEHKNHLLQHQNEEIEIQSENLLKINHTKDKLFSILGHDLRAPINSLKGLFHLLDEDVISQNEFIVVSQKLKKEVDVIHTTLNNLLEWSRSQLNGIQSNPHIFDLNEAILENITLYKSIADNKQIEIITELYSKENVFADENQIKLVIRNLISNAIKFTPDGGQILLKTNHFNNQTILNVQDSGVGIESDKLHKLFDESEIFTQKGTRGEVGTGLGLLLSKDMLMHNHCSIDVQSELGIGTTFTITFHNIEANIQNSILVDV